MWRDLGRAPIVAFSDHRCREEALLFRNRFAPERILVRRAATEGLLVVLALTLVSAFVLGCGAPDRSIVSTVTYEPPTARAVVVETVVALPFDAAWSELIRRLSESSYHVSTLEKASRFVRVDLHRSSDLAAKANKPSRYVDCGRTVRTYQEEGLGQEQRYEYEVAASSRHRESDPEEGGFRVSDVNRRVDLDASATIYLQPEGARRTRVTVKSRYRMEIEISGLASLYPSDPADDPTAPSSIGPRVESIRFTTFKAGSDKRSGGLICRPTGDFEHALVALANPAAAI